MNASLHLYHGDPESYPSYIYMNHICILGTKICFLIHCLERAELNELSDTLFLTSLIGIPLFSASHPCSTGAVSSLLPWGCCCLPPLNKTIDSPGAHTVCSS